jgi:hypothetical protein
MPWADKCDEKAKELWDIVMLSDADASGTLDYTEFENMLKAQGTPPGNIEACRKDFEMADVYVSQQALCLCPACARASNVFADTCYSLQPMPGSSATRMAS